VPGFGQFHTQGIQGRDGCSKEFGDG